MQQPHGIHTLDTGFHRPNFDAAYLIVENGRGAFVDCGLNASVPALLQGLAAAGLAPADVEWLILTHVHLDHAGGGGQLMQALPNARLVVHPRGARHMIDPSQLIAGASAVYGEDEVARTYGRILPVEAARVVEARDGHRIDLAGRELLCLDAPGHARHHIVIWDAASRSFFTGDTFGLSYREFDSAAGAFILPTTTPVQFEPEALKASIARMLDFDPEAMYLTHYGRVAPPAVLAQALFAQIDAMVAIARAQAGLASEARHAAICADLAELYATRAAAHGCRQSRAEVIALLGMDIELNAQGLGVWLDREARA
jgi:glyoxylase-like metal-dependent hydrolase (beta-lactamase superfamily II)